MRVELSGEMAGNAVIGPAIRSYAETHGVPPATADRVCLVVDELVANVIMHARVDRLKVSFELSCGNRSVTACVRDNGLPFDPTKAPSVQLDLPLEERKVGGLGLHFVRSLSHRLTYQRTGNENLVCVTLTY